MGLGFRVSGFIGAWGFSLAASAAVGCFHLIKRGKYPAVKPNPFLHRLVHTRLDLRVAKAQSLNLQP